MKLIATQTLTSNQPSIIFSDIPQNFTDLYILASCRSNRATETSDWLYVAFNSDTSSYSARLLDGSGTSVFSDAGFPRVFATATATGATSNTFANSSTYVPNYSGSTTKSWSADLVTENNATQAWQDIVAGLWSNTAPITSITLTPRVGSEIVAGSTISLYGVGGAGDGWAPKATGGVISRSGDYYVHTFTASGTFTPTASISCEYLVVAGGGGGGASRFTGGAGGGAGGYLTNVGGSALALSSGTNYTVTVGAGGSGSGIAARGLVGGNSVFSTITSNGGGGGASESPNGVGGNGGSGGGSGPETSVGQGNTPSTSPSQGNNGGRGFTDNVSWASTGGGGGASAAGGNGSTTIAVGGNGGAGSSSSITGTSVTRAGGGGGSGTGTGQAAGSGGAGGGGAASIGNGNPGTANTGGGGGGGGSNSANVGGNGGSGIVVVRYLA